MILPDINLLIHAHNLDSPVHEESRQWLQELIDGSVGVGLPWVVQLGFIRITTHPGILANPLPVSSVLNRLESWLALPHFHVPHPGERHFESLKRFLNRVGVAGNLTTDAHLAALAVTHGYELHTTDTDFARFPGLKWLNPIKKS